MSVYKRVSLKMYAAPYLLKTDLEVVCVGASIRTDRRHHDLHVITQSLGYKSYKLCMIFRGVYVWAVGWGGFDPFMCHFGQPNAFLSQSMVVPVIIQLRQNSLDTLLGNYFVRAKRS